MKYVTVFTITQLKSITKYMEEHDNMTAIILRGNMIGRSGYEQIDFEDPKED